jgi:hypothetical protein
MQGLSRLTRRRLFLIPNESGFLSAHRVTAAAVIGTIALAARRQNSSVAYAGADSKGIPDSAGSATGKRHPYRSAGANCLMNCRSHIRRPPAEPVGNSIMTI